MFDKAVRITKQTLGNQTRKKILYLDQNFFSTAQRGSGFWTDAPLAKIQELLDLQLLAVPYSPTHIAEADLSGGYRDELVRFIEKTSRGHRFEPYWRIEETQIVKAFEAFLNQEPSAYRKDEKDALPSSVHDWDGDYFVSVSTPAPDVNARSRFKRQALDELLKVLPQWANKARRFEDDVALEIRDFAQMLADNYTEKAARLMMGDFSARIDAPVNSSVVETMLRIVQAKKMNATTIGAFFRSPHFEAVPTVQLSARLFSAYKNHLRSSKTRPDPTSRKSRDKLSGFLDDVQHASTYAPYCDGYFTDKVMAKLMQNERVEVEAEFGCKVFSVDVIDEFLDWLEGIRSTMTPQHAKDLSWVYPRYRRQNP